MMDHDPLNEILREWQAPEPGAALDEHVRAAYRERYRPSLWRAFLKMRISVPAPALAAVVVVLALGVLLQFRSTPAPVAPRVDAGYVTRLDATGFQPLPNGAARVVPVGAIQQ